MAVTTESIKELNNIDIELIIPHEFILDATNQIDLLHCKDDGFITIAVKKKEKWVQYHYKVTELKANIGKVLSIEGANIYISPNSFYKPSRKIENIRKLNSLYIDLDYYTIENLRELTTEQILWILEKDYFKKSLPTPSFILITGRGIAIYWLIEPVPCKALPLWNAAQKYLLEQLKEVGSDIKSIDSARVMRLAGSVNQKNGKLAKIQLYNTDYKYSLREIQEQYLPQLTPYVKNPCYRGKGRKAKVVNFYTLYSLHYARLRDLIKIQDLREGYCRSNTGQLIEAGQREFMCFLYRYWSCCYTSDFAKALEDTLEFNSKFKAPLSINNVKKTTISAEKAFEEWLKDEPNGVYSRGGYNYKNDTLIKALNITLEEIQQLETIIDKKEVKRRTNIRTNEHNKVKFKAKRRNEEGLTQREQQKHDTIKRVQDCKTRGLSQSKTQAQTGLSLGTVRKYWNI